MGSIICKGNDIFGDTNIAYYYRVRVVAEIFCEHLKVAGGFIVIKEKLNIFSPPYYYLFKLIYI